MKEKFLKIMKSESGQGLSEYGLMIALIAVACIAALAFAGSKIAAKFKLIGTEIEQAKPIE